MKDVLKLKDLLDSKVEYYNTPGFIESDPISIPRQFSQKEDIEISAFLAATIAWGQRVTIINNAQRLMALMDHAPYDFIMNHQEEDLRKFTGFVHRTFNYDDILYFIIALKNIYTVHGGLENTFRVEPDESNVKEALGRFRKTFFELEHLTRTGKHVSNPFKGSACKRINMYLRWMVRKDDKGVDLGIWDSISPSKLSCPLDVHSGRVARKLKLLKRPQDDWKAVEELDVSLRLLDPEDPVKYDFALFGIGVFEN